MRAAYLLITLACLPVFAQQPLSGQEKPRPSNVSHVGAPAPALPPPATPPPGTPTPPRKP